MEQKYKNVNEFKLEAGVKIIDFSLTLSSVVAIFLGHSIKLLYPQQTACIRLLKCLYNVNTRFDVSVSIIFLLIKVC